MRIAYLLLGIVIGAFLAFFVIAKWIQHDSPTVNQGCPAWVGTGDVRCNNDLAPTN